MITHIRMKNFKSWKDSVEVKLAPLTGFFGTNSSGKSSLLQMLLLLKQTIGTEEILFFGDENSLVNLGSFREVIHGHNVEESLELGFGCKIQNPFTIEVNPLTVDSFTFEVTALWQENTLPGLKGYYRFKYGDQELICADFSQRIYEELCWSGSAENSKNQFTSELKELFDRVRYIGPVRIQPQRHYHWEGTHPESIGQRGEEMISALLSARIDRQTTPYEGKNVPIEERISAWLREMELAYSFLIERTGANVDRDYDVFIQKTADSAKVNLPDMGYGLSQFLPVLVLCYYAPVGSTLILEQPGIHLHPKVQSELADLLIEVVNERNLQILVESHSEHLLNRLQRRIAEEKISVDKTALYFCRNDEGVSNIERLKMDEFGNISNWPENFFGNEMGELFARAEAEMERRKKMEG